MPAAPMPLWARALPPAVFFVIVAIFGAKHLTDRDRTETPPDLAPCNCDHASLQGIMDRERQVEALIEKINDEMSALDPNVMYTEDLYAKSRKDNVKSVNKLNEDFELSPTGGGGVTNPLDCKPHLPQGTTKCIQGAFQAHENVHQRECLAFADRPTNRFSDWKKAKTMVEFWQEDLEGYQAELGFLKEALTRATAPCTTNYPGAESKEEQQQRLAGSKRRVTQYVAGLS